MDRKLLGAIAVVVLVAAAFSIFAYARLSQGASTTTTHSIETVEGTGPSASAGSEMGLQLQVSLNGTQFSIGQTIQIEIQEYNPLGSLINATPSSDYPSRNLGVGVSPCTFVNQPTTMSVFQGFYGLGNYSEGLPLQLSNDAIAYSCPHAWKVSSWIFEPTSNETEIQGCYGTVCYRTGLDFSNEVVVTAYGTYTVSGEVSFTQLTPGVYTVAAGDEWGAAVILHFTIT